MVLNVFLIVFLLLVILETAVIISAFVGFVVTRVPFVSTARKDIEIIVKHLPITEKDFFFDLGSGDGKVVFIVEELSGAKTRGFELTLWTYFLAKIKKVFKHSQAQFRNQNFF